MEELIKCNQGQDSEAIEGEEQLVKVMTAAFPTVNAVNIQALLKSLRRQDSDNLGTITKDIAILKGTTIDVVCRANTGPVEEQIPVLFEPAEEKQWPDGLDNQGASHRINVAVKNTTRHDIVLQKCTLLGRLQHVRSATPVEVKRKEPLQTEPAENGEEDEGTNDPKGRGTDVAEGDVPNVPLGAHLTDQQKQLVRDLLQSETTVFSKGDEDLGTIEDLELEIQLSDHRPVQKTYVSVPRPLYPEVKQYLEDLLNRGWITKSKSPYSSPVVCVQKKKTAAFAGA